MSDICCGIESQLGKDKIGVEAQRHRGVRCAKHTLASPEDVSLKLCSLADDDLVSLQNASLSEWS